MLDVAFHRAVEVKIKSLERILGTFLKEIARL